MSAIRRSRIMTFVKILYYGSNVNNPLSTIDIIKELSEEGFDTDRKTVRSYIDRVNESGDYIEIIKGSPNKFYWKNHAIDFKRAACILRAMESSGEISREDKEDVIEGLLEIMNKFDADMIKNHMETNGFNGDADI